MNAALSLQCTTGLLAVAIVVQADIVRTLGRRQYHKFHIPHKSGTNASSDNNIMPRSRDEHDVLNRLQQLADTYPAYVTLTSTQTIFGDDERKNSYALIIQDKQDFQDAQVQSRTDVSFEQSELRDGLESRSNIRDALHWLHQSVVEDDTVVTGTQASTQDDTANKNVVPSNTAHKDIILSSADIGDDNVLGLAKLMLEAASCEFMDDVHDIKSSYIDTINSSVEFASDRRLQCRNDLKDEGVDSQDTKWLANLVLNRRTIILPTAPAHGGGGMNLPLVLVACMSLLAVLVSMTIMISKRNHRSRIWVEEEAKRQIAEFDSNCDCVPKDYTRELTSFDEELTVQLIEPSHSVVLV